MNKLCIYHGNCADGFGAALVVRCALGLENEEFHAGFFGKAPPDVTGKLVYIVDFSYPRDILIEMASTAERIVILDHHATAERHLVNLPDNVETHFDMNRSGVIMAWDYFFPGEQAPRVLYHIQDRDLWRFEMDNTREIQAALFSHPYDFDLWFKLAMSDDHIDELISDGKAITRKHLKDVDELINVAKHRLVIGGHNVPALNAPYFYSSEAGEELGRGELFGAVYWLSEKECYISLRSAPDGLDVAVIAEQYGGGGHEHAAAFRISREQLQEMLP